MGRNMDRLSKTFDSQTKMIASASIPTFLELGKITSNLSLKPDSLKDAIPPNQYLVNLILTHETYYSYNEMNSSANAPHVHQGGTHPQKGGSGYHTHRDGLHDHRIPSVFRRLQPGDRVLIAWASNEPCVIAIMIPGDTITPN